MQLFIQGTAPCHHCSAVTHSNSRGLAQPFSLVLVSNRPLRNSGQHRCASIKGIRAVDHGFGTTKPRMYFVGDAVRAGDGMSSGKIGFGLDSTAGPPQLSKSDEEFLDDGVEFVWGHHDVDTAELIDLFGKVGFPTRDPLRLRQALDNTHTTLWIRALKKSRWARANQMIAFGRATSDGHLTATIWDVAVNPSWQRVGLGRGLVERLVLKLRQDDIPTITLYAEPNVVKLYEKLGFEKDVKAIKGMAFQKTSREGKELIAAAGVPSAA